MPKELKVGDEVTFKNNVEGMGRIVGFDRISGVIIEPLEGPTRQRWHERSWYHPDYSGQIVTANPRKVHKLRGE